MNKLEDLEQVIAEGLAKIAHSQLERKRVALALLEIHDGKRYYEKGYRRFGLYLWPELKISRARGYQLLNFARQIKLSTAVDTSGPANERQARLLDAEGKPRRPRDDDPVLRAMNYLVKAYDKLPPPERGEFVESMQKLLREMQMELESKKPGQA